MKKSILAFAAALILFTIISCGGEDKKPTTQEQQAVEEQVNKDQQAMDSLEKAIQAQIDAVSEDSLMKTEH
jgi:uncharacterized protein YcfL